jgi:hypothetical protein
VTLLPCAGPAQAKLLTPTMATVAAKPTALRPLSKYELMR